MADDRPLPPVFVISLAYSTNRRTIMAERLDYLKVAYSFFDAVNGATLDLETLPLYAKTRRRLFFGRDMTKGEVGCLLSHRAVYQHMLNNDIPCAIVLEDDAILSPDFPAVIRSVLSCPVAWDMVRFLDSEKVYRKSRAVAPLAPGHAMIRTMIPSGGAYGYILTKKAAGVLLDHMRKNFIPIDTLHGYVWKTGLNVFAVNPSPVRPDRVIESTIGDARFDKGVKPAGWIRAVYPFTRFFLRLYEALGKRWSYWTARP